MIVNHSNIMELLEDCYVLNLIFPEMSQGMHWKFEGMKNSFTNDFNLPRNSGIRATFVRFNSNQRKLHISCNELGNG